MERHHFPVVIIGAGPAGLSLAAGLKEAHIDFLLLEKEQAAGGQVLKIPSPITNYAFRAYENGLEAVHEITRFLEEAGLDINFGEEALTLDKKDGEFLITTNKNSYLSPNVVIASGANERQLRFNFQADKSHPQECQQVFYHSQELEDFLKERMPESSLAIVGGGDSALLEACNYARFCKQIYVIHRNLNFKARPDVLKEVLASHNILLLAPAVITELVGSPELSQIKVRLEEEELTFQVQALLAKTGYIPQNEPAARLLKLAPGEPIAVDANNESSCPGLFAAGDVTANNFPRIAIAIGQGMQICQTIIERNFPAALNKLDLPGQIEQSLKHFRYHKVGS